ncbi:MAG TPA: hemolysin family protein [Dongiaceae bacterium]|jgi:CBS domain containing-hemolysin-like protein|nr:hemolysin family protein [Dongiaceae bacterium]
MNSDLHPRQNGGAPWWRRLMFWQRPKEGELREAIEELIEESGQESEPDHNESGLLRNVLKFTELTARDVMVPRADIIAAPATADLGTLVHLMEEHGHSRLPIFGDNLDHVLGIVHIKDLLSVVVRNEQLVLTAILREAIFVAPSVRVVDLLVQMRMARTHMALVVDEFGGIDGMVTIEDLVEQITGEIEDEHDAIRHMAPVILQDGTCYADARTNIDEFEEAVGPIRTREEREADIDTLGGLVMALAGRVPSRGELILHPTGLAFEVLDADPRRIRRLCVRNLPKPHAAP